MSKPAPERIKFLMARAQKRADEIRDSKVMRSVVMDDDAELRQALADQQYCCAWAEAWGELCAEATQRVIDLQPPG